MQIRRAIILALITAAVLAGGAGCSVVPAKIRVTSPVGSSGESLGAILDEALSGDDQAERCLRLAEFVSEWFVRRDRASSGTVEHYPNSFRITFRTGHPSSHLPDYFDELVPAHHVRVKRIERHTRTGVGGPLLALRENEGREQIESYYPPEAITRPVTAVVTGDSQEGSERHITIELFCPLAHETVLCGGKDQMVAADFSVSWAALLSRARALGKSRVADVFRTSPRRDPQLYLMQPYDPVKEPLIMIHGLIDTPLTWAELSNDLWADPEIRQRYQIWHYLYNTSAPALYAGRLLRNQLKELRPLLDPGLDDPAMQSTTLLTHSMGGIVGRSLIVEPGNGSGMPRSPGRSIPWFCLRPIARPCPMPFSGNRSVTCPVLFSSRFLTGEVTMHIISWVVWGGR